MKTVTISPVLTENYKNFVDGFLNSSNWNQCEHGDVYITDPTYPFDNQEHLYILCLTVWNPNQGWYPGDQYSYSYLRNDHFGFDIYCHPDSNLYKYNCYNNDYNTNETKQISSNCSKTMQMNDYEFGEFLGIMIANALNVDSYLKEYNQTYTEGDTNIESTE